MCVIAIAARRIYNSVNKLTGGAVLDRKTAIGGSVIGLVALLATFTYLFIGFTQGIWSPTWIVFLAIPFISIIVDIFTKKKDPVALVSGIVSSLCAIIYLCMGFFLHLWHPGWLIFFAIPVSGIITKMFVGEPKAENTDEQTKA